MRTQHLPLKHFNALLGPTVRVRESTRAVVWLVDCRKDKNCGEVRVPQPRLPDDDRAPVPQGRHHSRDLLGIKLAHLRDDLG